MAAASDAGQCVPQASAEVEAGFREHALDPDDVTRLPAVRGARQRQILVAKTEFVRRAGLDQGERLQRLHGGAREDRHCHVAQREHALAVGVDDSNRATMPALHQRSAQHFDQNRIVHRTHFDAIAAA